MTDEKANTTRRYSDDAKDRDAHQLRTFKLQVGEMRNNAKDVLKRVVNDPDITVEQMRVLAMYAGASLDCFFSIDKDHHRAYPIEDKAMIVKQLRKNDASVRLNAAQRMGKEERIRRKQATTTQRNPTAKTKKTSSRSKPRTRKHGGGVGQKISNFFGLDTDTELKEEAEQRRNRQAQMHKRNKVAQREAAKEQEKEQMMQQVNDKGTHGLQQLVQGNTNFMGVVQMFIPEVLLSLGLPPQFSMLGVAIVTKGGMWIYNKFKGDGKGDETEKAEPTFDSLKDLQNDDFHQKHFTTYSGEVNKEKRDQFWNVRKAYNIKIESLNDEIKEYEEKLNKTNDSDKIDEYNKELFHLKNELAELKKKSSNSAILKNMSSFSLLDRMNPFFKPPEGVKDAMDDNLNKSSFFTHLTNLDFGAMILKASKQTNLASGTNLWIKGIINAVIYIGGACLLAKSVQVAADVMHSTEDEDDELDNVAPPPTSTKRHIPWTPKTVRRASMFAQKNPLFTTSFCFATVALLWQLYHQHARYSKNKQMAALLSSFEPRQDSVDSDPCTYRDTGYVLERVDPDLHETFMRYETTHIGTRDPLEKVFYHVLTTQLRQKRTSLSVHREVMNEHLIRSDGTIRESVGEIARAVKHYAKVTNVVGRSWAYVKGLLGKGTHRARSSRRSSLSKTAKRIS